MWFEPGPECFDAPDLSTFVSLFDWVFMYNMYSKCYLFFKELRGNPGEMTLELGDCAKASVDSGLNLRISPNTEGIVLGRMLDILW